MSRTTVANKRTGKEFPKKSKGKNGKNKKFFGWREGYPKDPVNAKKGIDFMNYGYPVENRSKGMLQRHIEDEMLKSELKDNKLR